MNDKLFLRVMTPADLDFADSVRALAGWNQTRKDWQRFLAHQSDGCFIAEWDGVPAGVATTIVYGTDLAWIGMVLVHPQYRRRGLGRALLQQCLDYLTRKGIRSIKLDATPLGQTLYTQLGFQSEWSLTRWELDSSSRPALTPAGQAIDSGDLPPMKAPRTSRPSSSESDERLSTSDSRPLLSPWTAATIDAVGALDFAAFGVSRRRLLESLAGESRRALVDTGEAGRINGYGLLREGARANYLGPIVAASAATGAALVHALTAHALGRLVYWDIPDANSAAQSLAKGIGFVPQRPLVRMFLGHNDHPGNPALSFGIADPSVG